MRLYTIRNDFHGSEVRVRCEGLSHYPGEATIRPTASQIKRIYRELCCSTDCTCGGIRGPQSTDDGKRLVIDLSEQYAKIGR